MTLDPNEARRATAVGEAEKRKQVRKAAVASVVGTSIEWYDFFLYGTAAALVFPTVFFPDSSEYAGQLESFATLAVGFAARPVGAAIFGHWGDRIGRKATLIVTLLLMGVSTAIIGVLPGTDTIGLAAPVLLVLLRLLQGIAVGGEWSGSVLLAMEWGDQKRRGLMGSYAQIGVPVGLLLGTGGLSLLYTVAPDAFLTWGWRIPFLASLVLVAIGLWVRLRILETPMFAKLVEQKTVSKLPVVEVVKRHPKEIALTALSRFSEQMPFYIFTTFVLSYVVSDDVGLSEGFALNCVMAAAALQLVSLPLFSHLSDRIGRKRVYNAGIIAMAVYGFLYFGLLNTGSAVLVFLAIVLSLVPHDMQYGPQAALIAESFPTSLRYGGAGIGYQLSSVFAGGPAPLVATVLIEEFGTAYAISGFILFSCVVSLVAVILLPDRSRIDITDDSAYARKRQSPARA
ncbi:MAG: MHS family MFS transporter [Actinomycetota bacterium]|nr:MHS family MFS transporter [Actinomycetota bacterium]